MARKERQKHETCPCCSNSFCACAFISRLAVSSHAVPRQVLFTSVSRVISTPLLVPLWCWHVKLASIGFGFRFVAAFLWPPGPSLPSLSGLLNDHLCCRGRRGASCRALVRPGPASWHAAFSMAQFGQTVVTQFWAQRCHVKEPQTGPAKRSDSQIRSTLHCEYKQGRISSDPRATFAFCSVGPIVGHGSRRIRAPTPCCCTCFTT